MAHFSKPMVGLIALAVAAIIIGNLVLPANSVTPPPEDHQSGPGCYCHNDGIGIWVDGNDWYIVDTFPVTVESGKSFTLSVTTRRVQTIAILPGMIGWMPSMADNVRFKFNPQEVRDDSAEDTARGADGIDASFTVVAPDKPGMYTLSLSAEGQIISVIVTVNDASGGSSSGSAAILGVESPSVADAGASVGLKVTLQNTGSVPRKLYMYVTDRTTGTSVLAKVYSEQLVPGNGTVTLSGTLEMISNDTLTLTVHGGYVLNSEDSDVALFPVSVLAAVPSPPIQTVPIGVLARQWIPWIAVIASSLVSAPLVGSYAARRKHSFPKPERLKMAVVECGGVCGNCRTTTANIGGQALNLLARDVALAPIATGAVADPVDVAFVVGAVRSEEDVRTVKEAREKARVLVAYGACSVFGLLPAGKAVTSRFTRPTPMNETSELMNEPKPLSDYVKVDLVIPGCPPPPQTVNGALETVLHKFNSKKSETK